MKIRYYNQVMMSETEQFKLFEKDFDQNIEFLDDFTNLIKLNGRIISFISDKNFHIVNAKLLENSVQTLRSIKLCCSIGSFSDANTLVRKLRDDLLLYTYILTIVNKRKSFTEDSLANLSMENQEEFVKGFSNLQFNTMLNDDEKAVTAWLENKVLELPRKIRMNLSFENYMKVLRKDSKISQILVDYKLGNYWEILRSKLNNYIHNNGSQFSSHNLIKTHDQNLEIYFGNVNVRTSYIITLFLVLITMIESSLISSGDMIDYLDCGMEPPEDCQYEIAAFIQSYIDDKVVKIHPELKQFLKDNNINGMKII